MRVAAWRGVACRWGSGARGVRARARASQKTWDGVDAVVHERCLLELVVVLQNKTGEAEALDLGGAHEVREELDLMATKKKPMATKNRPPTRTFPTEMQVCRCSVYSYGLYSYGTD